MQKFVTQRHGQHRHISDCGQARVFRIVVLFTLAALAFAPRPAMAQGEGAVITTNFPEPGGTLAAPPFRLFPPIGYGDYSNMETDPTAISAADRDSTIALIKAGLPNGMNVRSMNRWQDAQEASPDLQIVNNVPIAGATYTLFLPPGWKKSSRLPVLLSGNGAGVGNNERLWKGAEILIPTLVGKTARPGRSPLIAAFSNAGGTESQGIDEHTLRSVGAFFDFIGANGGDPQRAIMAGASRGGGTALVWGANPLGLNYTAQAVFADIPPTAYGTLAARSVLTYPNLGYIYIAIAHQPDAYRYASPNGPTTPKIETLIGTNDLDEADRRSPLGLAEKLRGKILVIARGTHDAFFPLWEFLRFDRRLDSLGIPHTSLITLGQGHAPTRGLFGELEKYIDALAQGTAYQPPTGRHFFINLNPPGGPQVPLADFIKSGSTAAEVDSLPAETIQGLPFTAEIPSHAGAGNPVDIAVCGPAGGTWRYQAVAPDGKAWTQAQGTFDANECAQTTLAAPTSPGEYTWSFEFNGKTVPPLYTPLRNQGGCGLPATTIVTMQQPSPGEINGSEPSLGFGVDQYSAQDPACIAQ
jgi:hypothetical protein